MMRRIMGFSLGFSLGFMIAIAQAGTLTITASGFSTTGVSAPVGWPANVTWPASQSPNGTKSYTISDADWLALLTWAASSQFPNGTVASPSTPTTGQLLLSWVQIWVNGTKSAVQQYFTTPATIPNQITIQ